MSNTELKDDTICNAAPQPNLQAAPVADMTSEDTKVLLADEKTMIQQVDELKAKLLETENEKVELKRERDQAVEDVRNVESAFSDVHSKYERAKKNLLESYRMNQETLKKSDQEMRMNQETLKKSDEKMEERISKIAKEQESLEEMTQYYEGRLNEIELKIKPLMYLVQVAETEADGCKREADGYKKEADAYKKEAEEYKKEAERKGEELAKLRTILDRIIGGQMMKHEK